MWTILHTLDKYFHESHRISTLQNGLFSKHLKTENQKMYRKKILCSSQKCYIKNTDLGA